MTAKLREETGYETNGAPSSHPPLGSQDISAATRNKRRDIAETLHMDAHERTLREIKDAASRYLDEATNNNNGYVEADREFLREYFAELVTERDARAKEVESAEVIAAANVANEQFEYPMFAELCVDGRLNPTLLLAMIAHMKGGAIQTPAGDSNDFAIGKDGVLIIRKDSNIARQLAKVFSSQHEICQALDSHIACAAREHSCEELAYPIDDHGLYQDVLRKRGMADALRTHVGKQHPDKKVVPIQLSFDPHNGYMYMGLETDAALTRAQTEYRRIAQARGENSEERKFGCFSDPLLTQLAEEGTILSTKKMADEETLRTIFEESVKGFNPPPDWRAKYKDTALQFWTAIKRLRPTVLPVILEKLDAIPAFQVLDEREKNQRAMMLFANAFNAFCNNWRQPEYPYGIHDERFVSVTERDYRPCKNTGFAVYSLDHANLSRHVAFAAGIVRRNRKAERIPDDLHRPIPVIAKEIVRETLTEEEWASMRRINWNFLHNSADAGKNWFTMQEDEFETALLNANARLKIESRILRAIKQLRRTMSAMYDPHKPSAEQLLSGKIFAWPIISDKSRRFRMAVPFFLRGY